MFRTKISKLGLFSSAAFMIPALALGQTAASASPSENNGLEEIVVTAQKRAQSVETVGMSINALSAGQLRELGINGVSDLVKIEPSFNVTQSVQGQPIYSIRGVGFNSDTIAAPPAVSIYVDEVPFPFPSMSKGGTIDLERIEILKGPQGTLFGENATGGAINYIAAKPTDELKFGVDATEARFNETSIDGFVSGPVTDTLKARLAVSLDEGGAWQRSVTRDDRLGDKDNKTARLLLDWEPTDRLKVSVNLNGWTDNSETQAAAFDGVALQFPSAARYVPLTLSEPIAPRDPRAADWLPGTHPANDESFAQGAVRVDYKISDRTQLTYIGTYQHFKQNDLLTSSGITAPVDQLNDATVSDTYHELRLSGKLLDDELEWLAGGDFERVWDHEADTSLVLGDSTAYSLLGLPGITKPLDKVTSYMTQDINSGAVFGNLEYHILDELSVHAGARYTKTNIDHTGCTKASDSVGAHTFTVLETLLRRGVGVIPVQVGGCESFNPATLQPDLVTDSLDQNNVSFRFGVDWTPIEKTLLYATFSRGFKAGSFPNDGVASNLSLEPAKQEELTAYEVGFKTRLDGNRLQADGALFYYNYNNKQEDLYKPDPLGVFGFLSTVLNVPKSEVRGAELTVKYRTDDGLTLSGAATYLDSKVSGNFFNYNQFSFTPINFKGEPLPDSPKWTFVLGAVYDFQISNNYGAYIGGDLKHTSRDQSYFGTASSIAEGYPSLYNSSYTLLNLRAGIDSDDGQWQFEAFCNNVANTYYTTQSIRLDAVVRYTGLPTIYGLTVRYRY